MNEGWIIFGICLVFIVGGAVPLLKDRGNKPTPLPPRKETLRDWRKDG